MWKNRRYHIQCSDCDSSYIGESEIPLGTRLAEHRRPSCVGSPVVKHVHDTGHRIDWDSVRVLDCDNSWFERGVRESIQIFIHGSNLNRDTGRFRLPGVYKHLLKKPRTQGSAGAATQRPPSEWSRWRFVIESFQSSFSFLLWVSV